MFLALALAVAGPAFDPHPGDPFDLTFVPDDRPARLIGARPAALLAALPLPAGDYEAQLATGLADLLTQVGGDPAGGGLPPLRDITHVLTAGLTLSLPAAGRKGEFGMVNSWYVVRTADPFDWAGRAAGWFPAGEMRQHAGHRYRCCRVQLYTAALTPQQKEGLDENGVWVHFLQADPRTLLFAFDEDLVKRVIDRLKDGSRVTPPPLWDVVERCPLAVAADTTADRSWLTVPDELPPNRPALVPFAELLRAAGAVAVGVDLRGEAVRLTAAVSATDQDGLTGKLRAAARRTAATATVRATAGRATADVRVSLAEALAALAGDGDD